MFLFQLGREYKLSIAEILNVFPDGNIVFFDQKNLILDHIDEKTILERSPYLGGSIKISEVSKYRNYDEIYDYIAERASEKGGKFQYGLSVFGVRSDLKKQLTTIKKYLKEKSISSRFVNQDFSNVSSATIIGEKLVQKGSDFTLISSRDGGDIWLGKTIWVQDIEGYSKRDYGKSRDMQIGMLPPKLSQMMINIAGGEHIYDPFCGLGSLLIEAQNMGKQSIYGSDFNPEMVQLTAKNTGSHNIFLFDARDMAENNIFEKQTIDSIVTEGFLGEIMTKKNISHERISIQKKNLSKLYTKFFSGLQSIGFDGVMVISFPFWELEKKYVYFNEIYDILEKYCKIQDIFPKNSELRASKLGSLLYKRDTQLVGREIFKLKIKN
ncbi:methyltransferase domain-containing protein [Candidatus Gracilibacteria bacterium]|nr:methyltransferase domain-containing protein [Candidatus Gracilibacteria bacterium]